MLRQFVGFSGVCEVRGTAETAILQEIPYLIVG